MNTGHVVQYPTVSLLIIYSIFSCREFLVSSVYLTVLYTCCYLYMTTGIIFAETQNLVALRMSYDGITSLIYPISYLYLCAISYIPNIKQPTKEHQTSKERRHELIMMSFDVCRSLTPICLFSAYQTEWSGYYLFNFFFKVLRNSLLALL